MDKRASLHPSTSFLRTAVCGPLCACIAALGLSGCSVGPTDVSEVHYLAVPSGENINYFRVRVVATGRLGVSSYRSGWFSAEAVDSLYGNVSETGVAEAYKMKEELRTKINDAIKTTTTGYLAAAADPKASPDVIGAWLEAQRRVRAVPGSGVSLPNGAVEIEYDPGAGLAVRHAGEKLVFAFTSDPDAVIEAISAHAKDIETSSTVLRFADVVRQQSVNEVIEVEARNGQRKKLNALVVQRLDVLGQALQQNPTRSDLIREIEALRMFLETLR